jgi:hypothetical protein
VKRPLRSLLRFVVLLAAGTSLAGQQPAPPAQRATGAEGSNVTAIVVDVVVRDRQGNPLAGLTADDFQVSRTACGRTSARSPP